MSRRAELLDRIERLTYQRSLRHGGENVLAEQIDEARAELRRLDGATVVNDFIVREGNTPAVTVGPDDVLVVVTTDTDMVRAERLVEALSSVGLDGRALVICGDDVRLAVTKREGTR